MNRFLQKTGQAILIWLATHALAAVSFMVASNAGVQFEPVLCGQCGTTLLYAIIIGMVVSSPVIVLLIPALMVIRNFTSVNVRIIFSFSVIFILCAAVITLFINNLNPGKEERELVLFLIPYFIAAEISLFLIAKRAIFYGEEETRFESETIDL